MPNAQNAGNDGSGGSSAPQDAETLVAEIEATREDLAGTLDELADRVSPKRVAQRSTDRAKEMAGQAKEVLAEKAGQAKEVLTEKAHAAKDTVGEKAATAKAAVAEHTSHGSDASSVAVAGSSAPDGVAALPPTSGVEVPVLRPRPAASPASGPAAVLSRVPKEAYAGAAAALVALWLLSRRRG